MSSHAAGGVRTGTSSQPDGYSLSTAAHDEAERRAAARALLMNPMMTSINHPEEMALVRRHQVALKSMFSTYLGYPLVVEATFARLSKAPLGSATPARPAQRPSGTSELAPRAYTYLALVCAGLLAPDVGQQIPLTVLLDQVRADAAAADITIDDGLPERRSLVAAIEVLIGWGVLTQLDGSVAAWGEKQENVLLTINRSLLPHLLARPLQTVSSPADLWTTHAAAEMPDQPRRDLRRQLVENPLVRREDLTDAERDVLSRSRGDVAHVLEEAFGLTLEVRAEGAIAYDIDAELTDVAFPGPGTTRQAALLLLSALADDLSPNAASVATVGDRTVPGLLASWSSVDDALDLLICHHGKYWRAEVTVEPERLRSDVVHLLESLSLAVRTDEGLLLHPAGARYRPEPFRPTARARAPRRPAEPPQAPDPGEMLFTDIEPDGPDGPEVEDE